MTSQTLTAMLRQSVSSTYPDLVVDGLDKVEILDAVYQRAGWTAVVSLGRALRTLTWHPVIRALLAARSLEAIAERWMRLERFGHSRNYTKLLDCRRDGGITTLRLRHVARDGGAIAAVNDLFVWGIFIGLMEAAHVEHLEAGLQVDASSPLFSLYGEMQAPSSAPLPEITHTLVLSGHLPATAFSAEVEVLDEGDPSMKGRLAALQRHDLLEVWQLADAARLLGVSGRSLQRALHQEGTTFSMVVHHTRIEAAQHLMSDPQLKLTDIAFCVGFADQAHFTRTFRTLCDVPPSAFRALLLTSQA